jgi:sortase A
LRRFCAERFEHSTFSSFGVLNVKRSGHQRLIFCSQEEYGARGQFEWSAWNPAEFTATSCSALAGIHLLDCWWREHCCGCSFVCLGILEFQASQAKRFETVRETHVQTALPKTPLRPGDPFGRVAIPRIGLSAMVAEGDDTSTLARAVGHIPETAVPEGSGNVGLAGHRDTFFRRLGRVRLKDVIELETAHGKFRYEVVRTAVVDPERVEVLDSSNKSELTLVTCYPFHYIGAAPRRFMRQGCRVAERKAGGRTSDPS